ncbi:MAG: hypothetical protein K2X11_12445, partial [Acetobacteraceae bacterium]|nr:hypothetical protein [Acetobacteraceae bacterium]
MQPSPPDTLRGLPFEALRPSLRVTSSLKLQPQVLDLASALVGSPAATVTGAGAGAEAALLLQGMLCQLAAQELPGPGGAVLAVHLSLRAAPEPEEALAASLEVEALDARTRTVRLAAQVTGGDGRVLAEGTLTVRPPARLVEVPRPERPAILLQSHRHMHALLERAAALPPLDAAIAWPCDADSLLGPLEAAARGLLRPVLVGPRD